MSFELIEHTEYTSFPRHAFEGGYQCRKVQAKSLIKSGILRGYFSQCFSDRHARHFSQLFQQRPRACQTALRRIETT
ncbi:MAG: hypothetical protein PHI11_15230, partial [Gallionella sp.]|nr:hypothetical protein [Gallionella sp.]